MSSCSRFGYPTSLHYPLGMPPWARSFGASARLGGTSSTPAFPSGPCTLHVPGWTATIRRVHTSTARVSFDVAQTRDGRPYTKTSYCHSTSSEWPSSSRPDFPPTSPCGNRDFGADVPHRNRDHRAYGAVRRVHSFFPYNVTDARRLVLCAARYVFLQRTFKLWEARVGALGGARATLTRNDALARAVRFTGVPVFRTWQSLQRGGTLAALPHRAQSSVRVNATLHHPLVTSSVY